MFQSKKGLAGIVLGILLLGIVSPVMAKEKVAPVLNEAVKVDLNRASQEELESVRWIGPVLAERIVKYREKNGTFESIEELIEVPGIGRAKFEKIKDQITVR